MGHLGTATYRLHPLHSKLDFCPRKARKETNVSLHKANKGGFFSERADPFAISPNRRTKGSCDEFETELNIIIANHSS